MTLARLRSVLVSCAAGVIAMVVLAGCTAPPTKTGPPGTPEPEPTPLYATDEEALAAAKDSYARYIAVSNEIGHNGWTDLEPLKTVATGDLLAAETESGEKNRKQGLRATGDIAGEVVKLQRAGVKEITVYGCLDLTGTQIVDNGGNNRTSPNRTELIPFEIRFTKVGHRLLAKRMDIWSGENFC